MSSTKILIVVLIIVAVLFVVFVATGALSTKEPKSNDNTAAREFTKKKRTPGWSKKIKTLFGSLQPKIELNGKSYRGGSIENVGSSDKPFRTATFRLIEDSAKQGALIEYDDDTEDIPKELNDLKNQKCDLPNFDNEEPDRCSIVALKGGGKIKFTCKGINPCRFELVE